MRFGKLYRIVSNSNPSIFGEPYPSQDRIKVSENAILLYLGYEKYHGQKYDTCWLWEDKVVYITMCNIEKIPCYLAQVP